MAVARVNEKTIKMDIEYGKGGLFIRIENPFSGEIKYLNETSGEEKKIASIKEAVPYCFLFHYTKICPGKSNNIIPSMPGIKVVI
ncbi:hypothetical protein FYJ45_05925 [Eisenbergiella tayi]|uniref:Uncharacterized protein n=1 Tax=Eisenbergiella porci TaxID=2652274 RepID=A0A6N7WEG5_9FIRM|nr:hypothetical protein [Eisenbergiella porci]